MAKGKKDKKREKHQKMLKELRKKKREKMAEELSGTEKSIMARLAIGELSGTQKSIEARLTTSALPPNTDLLVMALEKLPQDHLEWALENCFFYYDTGQLAGKHLDNVSIAGKHVIHLCVSQISCVLGLIKPEALVRIDIPIMIQGDEKDQNDLIAALAYTIAHEITHARLGHSSTTEAKTMAERNPISEKYEDEVESYMQKNMAQLIEESNLAYERQQSKDTHWRYEKGQWRR